LRNQWITIGWALEGAALSWLYRRIPHRGLLYSASALLAAVFVRSRAQPVDLRLRAARHAHLQLVPLHLPPERDRDVPGRVVALRDRRPTGQDDDEDGEAVCRLAAHLLFLLLNIEIADFYSTGREIMFRFGVTLAQDLTYTIGWLIFGLGC
jgi:hypothetical protein